MLPSPPATPLRRWLERHPGLTLAAFGERLDARLKQPAGTTSSASLAQWATGAHVPRAEVQLAMSAVTGGEVSPLAWTEWEARRARAVKSRKSA